MTSPITPDEITELREKWAKYRALVERIESSRDDDDDDLFNVATNAGFALDDAIVGGLPRLLDTIEALRARLAEVERDRDALLAACKELLDLAYCPPHSIGGVERLIRRRARAAIANR